MWTGVIEAVGNLVILLVFLGLAAAAVALAVPIFVWLAGLVILLTLGIQRHYETRLLVESVLAGRTKRDFCLYLRSFTATGIDRPPERYSVNIAARLILRRRASLSVQPDDDESKRHALAQWEEEAYRSQPFELMLAKALEPDLQLVALGRPRDFRGIGVFSTDDSGWEIVAEKLMRDAAMLIVLPAGSDSLIWELSEIAGSAELLRKTRFVVPPFGSQSLSVDRIWRETEAAFATLGWECPGLKQTGCWFRLDANGKLAELVAFDGDYRNARRWLGRSAEGCGVEYNPPIHRVSATFELLPWWLRALAIVRAVCEGNKGDPIVSATRPHSVQQQRRPGS